MQSHSGNGPCAKPEAHNETSKDEDPCLIFLARGWRVLASWHHRPSSENATECPKFHIGFLISVVR